MVKNENKTRQHRRVRPRTLPGPPSSGSCSTHSHFLGVVQSTAAPFHSLAPPVFSLASRDSSIGSPPVEPITSNLQPLAPRALSCRSLLRSILVGTLGLDSPLTPAISVTAKFLIGTKALFASAVAESPFRQSDQDGPRDRPSALRPFRCSPPAILRWPILQNLTGTLVVSKVSSICCKQILYSISNRYKIGLFRRRPLTFKLLIEC